MVGAAFTPPGLWVTLAILLVLASLIFWKRRAIKRVLCRLRIKELSVGPVTVEIEPIPEPTSPPSQLTSPPKSLIPSSENRGSSSLKSPVFHMPSTFQEGPAFQLLCYFARRKQCRLFIGSGVSSEAGMPSDQELREILGAQLTEMGITVRAGISLSELATALEKTAGRPYLLTVMQRIFDDALKNRPWEQGAYPWIPLLPPELVQVIFTTNWDDLLKRSFEATGQRVREIRHPSDLSLIPQSEHAVVKMHGDFQSPGGPVVSEADYAIVLNSIQAGTTGTLWGYLADQLTQYHFVFVGYSLDDATLSLIRNAVELHTNTVGEKRHFLVAPLIPEEAQAAERWAGVYVIASSPSKFFQDLIQELRRENKR